MNPYKLLPKLKSPRQVLLSTPTVVKRQGAISWVHLSRIKPVSRSFPGGSVVKNPPANAGDTGPIPGLGRSHMPRGNRAHVPQLLSPELLKPVHTRAQALRQKQSPPRAAPAHLN